MSPRRGRFACSAALLLSLAGCHGCWDDDDDDDPRRPAAPANLAVTLTTSGRIALSWTDNASNESGFLIERSPDGVIWTAVGTVAANATTHVDRGLLPLTQYFYRVSATGNGGSAPTAPVNSTTLNLVWDATTVGGGPSARFEHSAIYDPLNSRMILYGGEDFIYEPIPDTTQNNDVWALDLSTATPSWSALAPGGATAPYLAYHSAVYDTANARMIVFAGSEMTGMAGGPLNEVWALTLPAAAGTPTWSQLAPIPDPINGTPTARFNHSAVYDSANLRMIVYGGSLLGGATVRDTWALNLPSGGTPSWSRLSDGPEDRTGHSAIYDPVAVRMLVFAGNDGLLPTNPVFALSLPGVGSPAWTTLIPASASPPGPRFEQTAVLDELNQRMIAFGGTEGGGPVNDTWILPLIGTPALSAAAPAGAPPTPRMSHSAVYDPVFERMIVFSGDDGTVFPIDDLAWPLGF